MVFLRKIDICDIDMVYKWRNTASIVNMGTLKKKVSYEEHVEWFTRSVSDPNKLIFIIEIYNNPAGQIRFEKINYTQCIVSIYLIEEYIGHGYGCEALNNGIRQAFNRWPIEDVVARVRIENISAAKAFRKCGFKEILLKSEQDDKHRIFVFRKNV